MKKRNLNLKLLIVGSKNSDAIFLNSELRVLY